MDTKLVKHLLEDDFPLPGAPGSDKPLPDASEVEFRSIYPR